jgi:hypothetical protein
MAALFTTERLQRSKLFRCQSGAIVVSYVAAAGASSVNDLRDMSSLLTHGFSPQEQVPKKKIKGDCPVKASR